jgi:hypothetical protein
LRYDEARARLVEVPTRLPAPPPELMPVVLAGPSGTPGRRPTFPDLPRRDAAVLILLYPDAAG